MSLLSTLARLEAVRSGRAEPLATVRHRHLSERPMVVVPLAAAGESGAPLAVLLGTDRSAPRLHIVPQPLNRTQRFDFLARVAADLLPYLESFGGEVEQIEGSTTDPATGEKTQVLRELCADAPQLIVPNGSSVRHLALLGRSTRFRRTAEDADPGPYPAPTRVPLLGRWLTHLTERAQVPGSSLLLPMTALLARHWATGQSHLEDQHLAAQLAWHFPRPGLTGTETALLAETERDAQGRLTHPPAGPVTDPRFDELLLAPAITRHDAALAALAALQEGPAHAEHPDHAARVEQARLQADEASEQLHTVLSQALLPTWEDVWRGLDLLYALPPAAHLGERWESDRWSYTGHRDRLAAGEPPQPKQDDAVTAARKLAQREREQARLDVQEALDDPLAMAEHRLAGEAFAGTVVEVTPDYDTSGRSPKPRPLVTVRTADRPHADPGREVHRAGGSPRPEAGGGPSAQKAVIVESDPAGGTVTVRLLSGMGRKKEPEPGSLPEPGDRIVFTLFELTPRQSAPLPEPDDTPWTHGGPPGAADHSLTAAEEWE
ncbi:membrane protein [Saccharothrix sp. ST-888]|uniref:membrane protein n=1 Tax=Saccharothrix sp. ST-888 TaxID=1427391 RepID=UPI0005ECF572|nr:membrane protein [Saccharothrix sp. ST-888]KJK58967.1 membrane protein [Saccharothrix sp. ST-888]